MTGIRKRYKDKNGKPYGPWFVQYPHARDASGKIIYRTKKCSYSKKLAEQFKIKMTNLFFERDKQGLAIPNPRPQMTFEELVNWYLGQPVIKAKRSYRSDVHRVGALIEKFGHLIADDIKKIQVKNYQAERLKERTWHGNFNKPATVNREVALMRAIYNLSLDAGFVSRNPCRKIKMLKENNARDRVLSVREFEKICCELSETARWVLTTAYHTGMRRKEVIGLTVDKVNLDECYIDLDAEEVKEYARRRVYFRDELLEVFKECLRLRETIEPKHNYLFVRKNGKAVKCIRTAFENACKRTGIENFRFHDLRHTYNTQMRKAGVHDTVTMKMTGHSTLEMYHRYNTVDEADGREAVSQREAYLDSQRKCY
jgi:integrase